MGKWKKYFYYVIVYDDGESVLSCKGITLGSIIKPGVHYSFAVIHFK